MATLSTVTPSSTPCYRWHRELCFSRVAACDTDTTSVCSLNKTRPHTAVLIDLHWLPTKQRIEYKLLLLTFRSLHGLAALYITDLLIRYEPTRALRSADAHLLEVPRCRLRTQGEKAFSSAARRLWNSLPLAMRRSRSN